MNITQPAGSWESSWVCKSGEEAQAFTIEVTLELGMATGTSSCCLRNGKASEGANAFKVMYFSTDYLVTVPRKWISTLNKNAFLQKVGRPKSSSSLREEQTQPHPSAPCRWAPARCFSDLIYKIDMIVN